MENSIRDWEDIFVQYPIRKGGNVPGSKSAGEAMFTRGANFPGRQFYRGAVFQEANSPGGNLPGGNLPEGNHTEGQFSWGQSSGGQFSCHAF